MAMAGIYQLCVCQVNWTRLGPPYPHHIGVWPGVSFLFPCNLHVCVLAGLHSFISVSLHGETCSCCFCLGPQGEATFWVSSHFCGLAGELLSDLSSKASKELTLFYSVSCFFAGGSTL